MFYQWCRCSFSETAISNMKWYMLPVISCKSMRWWISAVSADPWASYQIRNIAGCACAGNAGNVFPLRLLQRKPLVSDPGMHHGTCVTHVPWCMSGSLTCGSGKTFPAFPAHAHLQFYVSGKRPIYIWRQIASSVCNRLQITASLCNQLRIVPISHNLTR